jgi:hypothetical protein
MDFSQVDIHAFLRASVPHRFQDINPYDFEKFMAVLFRADGYEVEETEYSGDYGADLILRKDGVTTVVQVKRFAKGTPVSVGDVNQVIGARSYYKAEGMLVVTTSDFTSAAIKLSKSADVVLWNWRRLEKYISTVYMDGEDYHAYYRDLIKVEQDDTDLRDPFELKLLEINADMQSSDGNDVIEVHVGLSNNSDQNLTVHIDLPIIVSRKKRRQVTAYQWKENYFFHGVLVSGATVELACGFLSDQIEIIKPGDRMILHIHVAGNAGPVVLDEKLKNPSSNCYIVTYCYGRDSMEYQQMIRFRDEALNRSIFGRAFVGFYYQNSPLWIQFLQKGYRLSGFLKSAGNGIIKMTLWFIHRIWRL